MSYLCYVRAVTYVIFSHFDFCTVRLFPVILHLHTYLLNRFIVLLTDFIINILAFYIVHVLFLSLYV